MVEKKQKHESSVAEEKKKRFENMLNKARGKRMTYKKEIIY